MVVPSETEPLGIFTFKFALPTLFARCTMIGIGRRCQDVGLIEILRADAGIICFYSSGNIVRMPRGDPRHIAQLPFNVKTFSVKV